MTPERYLRIGQIFDEALELPSAERAGYLAQTCAGDAGLRAEVEALLASHSDSETFLSRPAVDVAAQLLAQNHVPLGAGMLISHYQVLSPLGAGGMGEVYLAEDTRLKRKVALKVLPEMIANDKERLRRFEREAFAASALNHPNILTIHEFASEGAIQFLATEFIDGETVRFALKHEPITLARALDIAIQTAQALAAAHAAGIVHRDIKPENIMIRKDGIVKVLDFGLAKLIVKTPLDTEAETKMQLVTTAGSILGTAAYMSPEQARGAAVDARSDIFSLGVVLYEMIARRHPFIGETPSHTMVAILEKDPPSLAGFVRDLPAQLEQIIYRAIEKNPDERYSSVSDLLTDLKQVQRRLEVSDEPTRSTHTRDISEDDTESLETSSIELVSESMKIPVRAPIVRRTRAIPLTLVGGLAVLIVVGIAGWQWLSPRSVAKQDQTQNQISPVIFPDRNLSYYLTVQRYRDKKPFGTEFNSTGREIFESGWKFKINMTSRQEGFLYLLDRESSGNYVLLFPLPSHNNGSAHISSNEQFQTDWYVFDNRPGTEQFRLVWAAQSVPELERFRELVNATDQGRISKPDDIRIVTDFLQQHADSQLDASEDRQNKQVNVNGHGSILVTMVELEHR